MNARRWASGILAAALAAAAVSAPAFATSVVRLGMRGMTAASSSIVHGSVLASSSRWNAAHTMIVTDVRVRVAETLRGTPTRELVVTQPGGRVGNLRTEVAGSDPFAAGEETVLFLARAANGDLQVVGLSLGRFPVETDAKTGRKVVRGMPLEEPDNAMGGGARSLAPEDRAGRAARASGLDEFLSGVRALVADVDAKGGK